MLNPSTPKAVTGKYLVLPLPGGPATTIMRGRAIRGSTGFQRRYGVREHVRWQQGRHEVATRIDDPESFETDALIRNTSCGHSHHPEYPLTPARRMSAY